MIMQKIMRGYWASGQINIGILCHQGLGDCVMMVPLIKQIDDKENDKITIHLFVKSKLEKEYLTSISWKHRVDIHVLVNSRILKKLRLFFSLPMVWRLRIDILLAPLLPDHIFNAIWIWLTKIGQIVLLKGQWLGHTKNTIPVNHEKTLGQLHKTEEFLDYAYTIGFPIVRQPSVNAVINNRAKDEAYKILNDEDRKFKWYALAIGSGEKEKNKRYPTDSFRKLSTLLIKESDRNRIVMIGSKSEISIMNEVINNEYSDRYMMVAGLELKMVLAILSNCVCAIGSCTGVMHLAAAAGIPIVGLYGPTDPSYTSPYTGKKIIIREGLECSPCYESGLMSKCKRAECMCRIKPIEVYKAVQQIVAAEYSNNNCY